MQNQPKPRTALLLFNYSEKQKASLKKIAPRINEQSLKSLIGRLNKRAKKITSQADLPFFQLNANSKQNFGEQLYQAYEDLFLLGYDQVIGISNDCPELNANDLRLAEEGLTENDFVFGPAKDGGLYLLGLKKEKVSKKQFVGLQSLGVAYV